MFFCFFLIIFLQFFRPKVLDNFALLSGQITSLMADLRSEKTPLLRNYPLVPLKLTQDSDPHLLVSL